jgi:hypothetical protein
MSEIRTVLADLRAARREAYEAVRTTPDERMLHENRWGGIMMDVRFFHLRFADHDEEHGLSIADKLADFGFRQSKAQRALGAAAVTHGELLGALIGLTDGDLDRAPGGEWPLRRTLGHLTHVEHTYRINTLHAAERHLAELPYEPPAEESFPSLEPFMEGGMATFIERMDAAREMALEALGVLPDAAMDGETSWMDRKVTVEFRLMRYAHHEREHVAHILKWRSQVGREQTESERLLALGWRARGVIESQLVGLPDEHLDTLPSDGGWPIRELLSHLKTVDAFLCRQIETAASPQ